MELTYTEFKKIVLENRSSAENDEGNIRAILKQKGYAIPKKLDEDFRNMVNKILDDSE